MGTKPQTEAVSDLILKGQSANLVRHLRDQFVEIGHGLVDINFVGPLPLLDIRPACWLPHGLDGIEV